MFHWVVVGLLLLQAPVPLGPTDAIGFDYLDADLGLVSRFEVHYDNDVTWTSVQIPPAVILPDTLVGAKTYTVLPPFTSGTHTVLVRACNGVGCGSASLPFVFTSVGSSPTVAPGHVRPVPRSSL